MTATEYLGDPGERLAAACLWQAMQGELHPATASDDDDKVDHRIVYPCPFTNQRRELKCQVKTGDSYGTWTKTKNRYRINLDEQFRKQLRANDGPTLLVWIPQAHDQVYYCLIPPHRNRKSIYVSESSVVNPAMLFDVARRQVVFQYTNLREINFSPSDSLTDSLKRLTSTKKQRVAISNSSVVRNVRLPLSSIRHVTRRSRSGSRRRLSCDVARYIPRILSERPRRVQCFSREIQHGQTRSQVRSLLLLQYPNILRSTDQKIYSLFFRISEAVSFPKAWEKELLCLNGPHSGTVDSRSSIQSWYVKRIKKC